MKLNPIIWTLGLILTTAIWYVTYAYLRDTGADNPNWRWSWIWTPESRFTAVYGFALGAIVVGILVLKTLKP